MTRYKCVIADFFVGAANYGTPYLRDTEYLPWTTMVDDDQTDAAPWHLNSATAWMRKYRGQSFDGYEDTHLHDRLWVFPASVDAGLIGTQYSIPISIWNSYQTQSMDVESTTLHNLDNITLNLGTLPLTLLPNQQKTDCTLTIESYGESTLDGYIRIVHTLAPLVFDFRITGLRILIVPLFGDWSQPYQIVYSFQSTVARTKTLHEQRKPLDATLKREIMIKDLVSNQIKYMNLLQAAGNNFFAIPIATESLTPDVTGSLQGLTSVDVAEDIAETHFNFTLSTHVMLYNTLTEEFEVRELATPSYADQTIMFTIGVVNDWDGENVVIYPILFGCIDTAQIQYITDRLARIQFRLKEFTRG